MAEINLKQLKPIMLTIGVEGVFIFVLTLSIGLLVFYKHEYVIVFVQRTLRLCFFQHE